MNRFVVGIVAVSCAVSLSAFGQNKVVFDNQSGDPALVKLIGPTKTDVAVPNGAKAGVDAAAGKYTIKVRYGTTGDYRYSKGQEFEVTETPTARSETTITLHKVIAGNYDAHPISESEFGTTGSAKAIPKAASMPAPTTANADAVSDFKTDAMRGNRTSTNNIAVTLRSAAADSTGWRTNLASFVNSMSAVLAIADLPAEPWVRNRFRSNITFSGDDNVATYLLDLSSAGNSIDDSAAPLLRKAFNGKVDWTSSVVEVKTNLPDSVTVNVSLPIPAKSNPDFAVDEYIALHLSPTSWQDGKALAKGQVVRFAGSLDRDESSFTAKNMYGTYVMYGLNTNFGKRIVGVTLHHVEIKNTGK